MEKNPAARKNRFKAKLEKSPVRGGPKYVVMPQVRTYLAKLPAGLRAQMLNLRDAIRSAAPQAAENFGYGMPAFELDGKNFIWYGAWKNYVSFYPLSEVIRRALADELARYDTSGKGTIRFRSDEDLPPSLVARLVRARIAELRKRRKTKLRGT